MKFRIWIDSMFGIECNFEIKNGKVYEWASGSNPYMPIQIIYVL